MTTSSETQPPPLPTLDQCTTALQPCLSSAISSTPPLAEWRKIIQKCLCYGTDYDRLHLHEGLIGGSDRSDGAGATGEDQGSNSKVEDVTKGDEAKGTAAETTTAAGGDGVNGAPAKSEGSELKSRAEEAGERLAQALTWYLGRWNQQNQQYQSQQRPRLDGGDGGDNNGTTSMEVDSENKSSQQDENDTKNTKSQAFNEERLKQQQRQLREDPVVCAVIEALWLVGCLLESGEDSAPGNAATATTTEASGRSMDWASIKKVPHECLLIILRHLTTPTDWRSLDTSTLKPTDATDTKDAMQVDTPATDKTDKTDKADKADNTDEADKSEHPNDTKAETTPSQPFQPTLEPLLPIASLQASLELSLLESANLLPQPPSHPIIQRPIKKAPLAPPTASTASTAPSSPGKRLLKKPNKPNKANEPDTPITHIQKKIKKLNTDMYYRQHKFNLLAEESEGFAKLLTFLIGGCVVEEDEEYDGECGDDVANDKDEDKHTDTDSGEKRDNSESQTSLPTLPTLPTFHEPKKYVRELIGAFDLDPNRVLDLALDALEWELQDLVTRSVASASSKSGGSSFAELAKAGMGTNEGFGLNQLRMAMNGNPSDTTAKAIHSLLAIIQELDGSNTKSNAEGGSDGSEGSEGSDSSGRAIAHLLGFKFRAYHARAVASQGRANAAGAAGGAGGASGTGTTSAASTPGASGTSGAGNKDDASSTASANSNNHTSSSSATRVYPRSLYLSTAFLCAHRMLDVHALLPHLISCSAATVGAAGAVGAAGTTSTAGTAGSGAAPAAGTTTAATTTPNIATPLMELYRTHVIETIQRLKKLGVVSLNASKADGKDGKDGSKDSSKDGKDGSKDGDATGEGSNVFLNDPIIGIFRTLLALVGDWEEVVAFLAHAAIPEFGKGLGSVDVGNVDGDNGEDVVAKMISDMEAAALAACSLSDAVASDVCAWVTHMVDDMYTSLCTSNGSKGKSGRKSSSQIPPSSPLPLLPTSIKKNYTLPKQTTLSEMSYCLQGPLAALVGCGKIKSHPGLYTKLCRLYRVKLCQFLPNNGSSPASSTVDPTQPEEINPNNIDEQTLSVLSTFLVPSLSLFPSDPQFPRELYSTLRHLPYTIRYRLYSAWRYPSLEKGTLRTLSPMAIKKSSSPPQLPKPLPIIESEIQTSISTKYILKRISKENIPQMGPSLAQVSHNNPLVVFTFVLNQIESYDNLILMMVDTFGFVTELGLDVLGYCLLVSLGGGGEFESVRSGGGGGRSRTKMDGLNTTQWLTSLETFTGAFYKKFPSVELRGILIYLTHRFQTLQTSELGVLRSLIKTVGGYGFVDYDSTASLSEQQLDGRCGSRLLKRETSSFGVVDNVNRKASRKLRGVLQGGDLGVIILILLGKMREKILFEKKDNKKEHIKVIGSMYDDCEAVLCLLLEYLSDSSDDQQSGPSTKERFAASLPPLGDLHEKFGLDTAMAWMLCRPLVRKSMFFKDDAKLKKSDEASTPPAYLKSFVASSPEMMSSYQKLLPKAAWKHITPSLFEWFYSLSIYDICCPEERYNVEINRLKKECDRLSQLQRGGEEARGTISALAAAAAAAGGSHDQIQQATAFTKTHAVELDRLKNNVRDLSRDFQRQKDRCKLVNSKLESIKESLVLTVEGNTSVDGLFASSFMTFCIYPRCFLSPEDSLYCAQIVKLLHKMKVPGFPTIELIDNIVNAATGSLYCVTEDEAGNLAVFLNEIWKSVNCWRYDDGAFAAELENTPGSRLSKEFAQACNINDQAVTNGITLEDYKSIYSQWHQKIGFAALGCLNSSEYMYTRSALILLSRIVMVFPTQPRLGERILKNLGPLMSDENPRPDIRATAQGYCSQLMKARDEGMWKEENRAATKARQEREKKKLEERRKKLEQQHEEMKKDSELISREIGDSGGWRRDGRDDRRRNMPWGADPRMHHRNANLNPSAPTFTPANGGEARELNTSFPQRRDGHDHGRGRTGHDHAWERDRGGGASESSRRKRSRSPDQMGDRGDEFQKRARTYASSQQSGSRGNPSYSGDRRSSSPSSRGGRHQPGSDTQQHGSRGERWQERRGGSRY